MSKYTLPTQDTFVKGKQWDAVHCYFPPKEKCETALGNNFLTLVVFGQYGSLLKDNIFHQSAEDRLWTGLAAGDSWWVKSAIRGAAISINQHTRVDTTNATIIIKVDTNTNTISHVTSCEQGGKSPCFFVRWEKFSEPGSLEYMSLCVLAA